MDISTVTKFGNGAIALAKALAQVLKLPVQAVTEEELDQVQPDQNSQSD